MTPEKRSFTKLDTAEIRYAFLADASTILASSLDYETTLKNVAALAVPRLADWCAIHLADARGEISFLTIVHSDPAKTKFGADLQRRSQFNLSAEHGVPRVLRTGEAEFVTEVTDALRRDLTANDLDEQLYRELGLDSYMIVPLITRGRILGTITFVSAGSGRHYSDDDLELGQDLARRAAVSVDNSRLYRAAQQEIEERRRVEEELRKSKDQLEIIFKSVADGITMQDMTGHLIYANDIAAHFSGYDTAQEMLDAPPSETLERFEIMDEFGNAMPLDRLPGRQALRGDSGEETILRYRVRATGEERWSIVKATPVFDAEGKVQFAINTTQDITARRRAEQQILALNTDLERRVVERTGQLKEANDDLETEIIERKRIEEELLVARDELEIRVYERTAELKAANDELSTFTYIVSHDLRSPMVNLKGFSTELRDSVNTVNTVLNKVMSQLDPADQETLDIALGKDIPEALNFIEAAVTRMDHLTSAVLKLSRLGRRELNPEPIHTDSLVRGIVDSLAHQLKQKQAQVTIEPLPTVMADRVAMEQIMGNILTNAVMYLTNDRPGAIHVSAEVDSKVTTFHIRDNGRGIADQDKQKIFEPFRRAGHQDVPGEGMGMAYVQALVRRHGGRIWYESEPGVGTTFSFSISNNLRE